ncbi:MAG: hypothetical protein JSR97_06585 [Verrucomicrobia bacterium]|nr:hypothetical protein [Verrucomicrobiota bacterium]
MTTLVHIATLTISALFLSCNGTNNSKDKVVFKNDALVTRDTTLSLDNPKDLLKNYNGENNRLFVFVGHKISVDPLPHEKGSMDGGFKAKYLVIEKVFGNFSYDTIEFAAYDHYGIPPFSEYNDALLFVSADSGTYYHQKYQYNDVYKTKDGQWAGTYAFDDYEHEYNKKTRIKPTKIEFAKPVYYPLKKVTEQGDTLRHSLPKPYFKTVGDSALAIYGNYVKDLFLLKRDGVLTARDIFKNGKLTD